MDLIRAGADVHQKTSIGTTALGYAAWKGHVAIALELVKYGASIHEKLNGGQTPLSLAKEFGHQTLVDQWELKPAPVRAQRQPTAAHHRIQTVNQGHQYAARIDPI